MRIVRLRIRNFRCIKSADIFPTAHNVFLGPNNSGKTAILEALNLLLNPEMPARAAAVDENDFYNREYRTPSVGVGLSSPNSAQAESSSADAEKQPSPVIFVEAVLTNLSTEDEDVFADFLVPWRPEHLDVVESTQEGADPFENAVTAVRVAFEGKYDPEEDDFTWRTIFVTDSELASDECPEFNRKHKRHIGFLIYRDFRALTRPITLEPRNLFARLLSSQEVLPRQFEDVLSELQGTLEPITADPDFASILNSYKAELERFLSLSLADPSALSFELTNRTRAEIKEAAQLYVRDECHLPLQQMGAGTRSLAILGILTLIMRRRQRGILALEEPETFLFPHAQRRVVDECLDLADQTFVTTHSPYVLERIPAEGVGRLDRTAEGGVAWRPFDISNVKHLNLYSKRLRQSFCEALLGKGVVVVEGDSDRWWLYGVSRLMNRTTWNGRMQEALELQGTAVVSTDSNGDLGKTGTFFKDAGLKVVCIADQVQDDKIVAELCSGPFEVLFLRYAGLEDLLADELPVDIIRAALTTAPHSRVPLTAESVVAAISDPDIRLQFRNFMIGNKGSAQLHEWLLAQLNANTLPSTLKNIVDAVSSMMGAGSMESVRMSIL